MSYVSKRRGIRVSLLWLVALGVLASGCSRAEELAVGMSSDELIAQLGEPESIKVLRGKVLEDVKDRAQVEQTDARVLFIYDRRNLRVWLVRGRVDKLVPAPGTSQDNAVDESGPPH